MDREIGEFFYARLGVGLWNNGPTPDLERVYPYMSIDSCAAFQRSGVDGLEEVAAWAEHAAASNGELVIRLFVERMNQYPDGVSEVRYTDSGRMYAGYERVWVSGIFRTPTGLVRGEAVWHRHDGYGEEAGRVEFFLHRS